MDALIVGSYRPFSEAVSVVSLPFLLFLGERRLLSSGSVLPFGRAAIEGLIVLMVGRCYGEPFSQVYKGVPEPLIIL